MLNLQQDNQELRKQYKELKWELAKGIRKLQIREAVRKQHNPLIVNYPRLKSRV